MHQERVSFYAESIRPIRLEGLLDMPDDADKHDACILCHPHPIGGGCMQVPLLETLARVLSAKGLACLRFNFRGVGGSSGQPSGGAEETEDVEGAFQWLRGRKDLSVERLGLAGWSFGAWVGLNWATSGDACGRIALINPPLVGFDFFHFLDGGEAHLPERALIVGGQRDQFADSDKLEELASRLGAELHILEGADHFLFGREAEVAEIVARYWLVR
ncbi:MAG: alpha/beta family hydrolase [Actinomycetota bacterium]|nr:alpha/beta family hydrolase [Actinomycetota bacterium]